MTLAQNGKIGTRVETGTLAAISMIMIANGTTGVMAILRMIGNLAHLPKSLVISRLRKNIKLQS